MRVRSLPEWSLQALPANIKRWNWLKVRNTPAYYETELITTRQSFNLTVAGTDVKSSSLSAHLRRHRRRHGRDRLEGPRRRRGHQAFPPPFRPEGARLRPAQHQALDWNEAENGHVKVFFFIRVFCFFFCRNKYFFLLLNLSLEPSFCGGIEWGMSRCQGETNLQLF